MMIFAWFFAKKENTSVIHFSLIAVLDLTLELSLNHEFFRFHVALKPRPND